MDNKQAVGHVNCPDCGGLFAVVAPDMNRLIRRVKAQVNRDDDYSAGLFFYTDIKTPDWDETSTTVCPHCRAERKIYWWYS